MWEAWGRGDRRAAVAAIPPHVIDDLLMRGPADTIRARIHAYLDAGVDTAFLTFFSSEPDPTRKRELVLSAMRALVPSPVPGAAG
jgi:alkanesulfonate monooxygenase SsuD/methylene tetrahydromethanopterin reductase-like flavin-dependent oxidoreductase (luciferase family)